MKELRLVFTENEYRRLRKKKGTQTWKKFVMNLENMICEQETEFKNVRYKI